MKAALICVFVSLLQVVRPDFGLINLLYWKADANLDHIISKAELETIWHGFDHNKDHHVTKDEFVPLWREVTGHSQEMATAYYLLADETDNGRIDQADLDRMYTLFDTNNDGHVSPEEFSLTWQKIILDVPFAVMFEHGDANKDYNLTSQEFNNAFMYMDENHDGQLQEAEFAQQWLHHRFGESHQAAIFFTHLDVTHDDTVTTSDLSHHFTHYDTSHNQLLTLEEFIQMSELVPPLMQHRVYRTSEPQSEVLLFDAVDLDNSTYLDSKELEALFLLFDSNNDSRITEIEFKTDWVVRFKLGPTGQAVTLFKKADVTKDGIISQSDLPQIFAYFDMNGNKQVDLNEFLTQWGELKLGPTYTGIVTVGR